MTTADTCAHMACLCTRPYPPQAQATSTARMDPNGEFCSRRCSEQEAAALGDGGCECGHPKCNADADYGMPPL